MYVRKHDLDTSINTPKLHKNSIPLEAKQYISQFKKSKTAKMRQILAHRLVKSLNRHFGLPGCIVKIHDAPRPLMKGRRKKGEIRYLCGLYTLEPGKKALIEVWNISETGRKLSWLQVMNVLLHEYIHHYDHKNLYINIDHDTGFDDRLKHLRKLALDKAQKAKNEEGIMPTYV